MQRLLLVFTISAIHSAIIDNCLEYALNTQINTLSTSNPNESSPSKEVCIECRESYKLDGVKCITCGTECPQKKVTIANTTKADQVSTPNTSSNLNSSNIVASLNSTNEIPSSIVQTNVPTELPTIDSKPIGIAIGKTNLIKLDNLNNKTEKINDYLRNDLNDDGKVYLSLENGSYLLKKDTCTKWDKGSKDCTECIGGFILNLLSKKCLKINKPILVATPFPPNNSTSNSTSNPVLPPLTSDSTSSNPSNTSNLTNSINPVSPNASTPNSSSPTIPATSQYNITSKTDLRTGLTIITIGTTKNPPSSKAIPLCNVYRDISYECVTCDSGSILYNEKCYKEGDKDIGVLYGVRVVGG